MPENTGGLPAGFAPGARIAGYVLQEQVGAGGMAVVFKATDERLNRTVALKILAPGLAADRWFRQRFVRESRAAAAVDDPHIVPVYEAAEAEGVLFIAMRYVPGGSVSDLLHAQGPLSPARVTAIVSPVASALDSAHQAGLVHRDVKPANMLIDVRPDRPDHVYLSDFGLTKGAQSSVGLTGTNQVLGTPGYMAPEQIEGRDVTGRTDQYALACAAFEMLTGRSPFDREQGMAVLWAHLNQPAPSLATMHPGLSRTADPVFARALAKAQDDRYANCRQFADALRDAFDIAPYHSGPGVRLPASHQDPLTYQSGPAQAFPVPPGPADPAAARSTPTNDRRPQAPNPRPNDLTRPAVQPHTPPQTPYRPPAPYRTPQTPYPPPPRPVSYRPQPYYTPSPGPGRSTPKPARRPSPYPPVAGLTWHFLAYLLPIIIPVYGLVITPLLLFKRHRSIRMSVVLALEIGLIWAAAVGFSIASGADKPLAPLFATLSAFCILLTLVLLIACIVQLCMRKQPNMPILSKIAYRAAYRK